MHSIVLSPRAEKDLKKLPPWIQKWITDKLLDYSHADSPLNFAKPLINLPPSTHRFRVGKYRISFYLEHHIVYVERIQPRSEAY